VGLTAVRVTAHVDVEGASDAEIDDLIAHAAQWSPVLSTVKNPVAIQIARG
jgi:organic hydroperoxide reductase OsmC/OhrA